MERQEIREAAKKVHERYPVSAVDRLKEEDLGDKAHSFTIA